MLGPNISPNCQQIAAKGVALQLDVTVSRLQPTEWHCSKMSLSADCSQGSGIAVRCHCQQIAAKGVAMQLDVTVRRLQPTEWHCSKISNISKSNTHGRAETAQSVQRLATGWTVRGSKPGGIEIFCTRPPRPWGPPSFLYNGYRVFPGGKAAGAWR